MTRLQIRGLIRRRLGETTAAFWTDTELNDWINFGCKDIAFRAKCIRSETTFNSVLDTLEYTLSSVIPNVVSINEIYFKQSGSTWVKLDPTNRTDLDFEDNGWRSASSSTPNKYFYDREENIFGLYPPANSDNTGVNYVKVFYTKTHTDLTDDNSTPQVPEALQNAIVDYVVALGYEQRGWGDKSNDAWTKYFSRIKDYEIERQREKEDEDIIMKNYRSR